MRGNPENFYIPQINNENKIEEWTKTVALEKNHLKPESNWCGICCIKMITKSLGIKTPKLLKMYEVAFCEYSVYKTKNNNIIGAFHKKLAKYIKKEFGLKSKAQRNLSVNSLKYIILKNKFFIASVSKEIRNMSSQSERQNGHLVLIYGFNDKGFIIHNSTGFSKTKTQKNVVVPYIFFKSCFSGSGISVCANF